MASRDPDAALRRSLVTPEGVTLHLQLATAGARAGAFVLDLLIMFGVLIGLSLLALLAFWVLHTRSPGLIAVIWLLGAFVLRNFYFVLAETGARAATLGKRILKLRVVARDGGRLTGAALLARNLMREVEIFLPLTFLGAASAQGFGGTATLLVGLAWSLLFLFFPLFNRDRMRAGDLIAGTWVIVAERRSAGADLLGQGREADRRYQFAPHELSVYGQFELQRLEEVLRRDEKDTIAVVAAMIRNKLGRADEGHDELFLNYYYVALRHELERKLLFGKRKRDKHDSIGDHLRTG